MHKTPHRQQCAPAEQHGGSQPAGGGGGGPVSFREGGGPAHGPVNSKVPVAHLRWRDQKKNGADTARGFRITVGYPSAYAASWRGAGGALAGAGGRLTQVRVDGADPLGLLKRRRASHVHPLVGIALAVLRPRAVVRRGCPHPPGLLPGAARGPASSEAADAALRRVVIWRRRVEAASTGTARYRPAVAPPPSCPPPPSPGGLSEG